MHLVWCTTSESVLVRGKLRDRGLGLLVTQVWALVVVLLVSLDVPWKEGVLAVQVLVLRVRHLILIVFLDYWLFRPILLIGEHRKVVRVSTTWMAIGRRNIDRYIAYISSYIINQLTRTPRKTHSAVGCFVPFVWRIFGIIISNIWLDLPSSSPASHDAADYRN